MKLYRIKLRPKSRWRTPWQADTLSGLLCWTAARHAGDSFLNERILEPAAIGRPPFVLSDAFPGALLPVPITVQLQDWPEEHRKKVKKATWLRCSAFQQLQRGESIENGELLRDEATRTDNHLHVTIGRTSDVALDGGLYVEADTVLAGVSCDGDTGQSGHDRLTIYARVADGFESSLMHLFHCLSLTGYGADTSTGAGQFVVEGELEPVMELDETASAANGIVTLSTFQPSQADPTDGYWQVHTKYGKIGPDFGLSDVFKRPQVMLRPGAFFYCDSRLGILGGIIPAGRLLSQSSIREIAGQDAQIVQYAYGLAVPFHYKGE